MAALDFPANPSNGDSYEPSGVGIRYVYSSDIGAWQAAASSVSGFLAISGGEITGNLIIDQNLTVTGTTTFIGETTASTVTGTTANFISGNFDQLTATSGTFTSSVGFSTVTGNAASFTTITGESIDTGNGAQATPSYSFTTDQDLGLFRPGANTLGVSTSGIERARFTESGSFMVGGTAESGSTYASQFTAYAEGNILTSSINPNVFDLETTNTGNTILALRSNVGGNDTIVTSFAADGSATFKGLTTHDAGVKITGGDDASVINGITVSSGGSAGSAFNIINIITDSERQVRFKNSDSGGLQTELFCGGPANQLSDTANVTGCFADVNINDNVVKGATYYGHRTQGDFSNTADNSGNATAGGSFVGYNAYASNGEKATSLKGFSWNGVTDLHPNDTDAVAYGFYSGQNNTPSGNAYSFFAAGTASNYFAGDTYIGGDTSILGSSTNINLNADGTAEFEGLTTHAGGIRLSGGNTAVNNGFVGNSSETLIQTVVDGVPIARSILGDGNAGGFSFGGTGVKASTMVSILAESVRNGLVCDLRVDADETSSDITTGANFGVSGPTTGTTGGIINFYIARLGTSVAAGDCTFTGTMSGYRISSNFGNLNTTGKVYGFLSSVNQNNKFGTAVENYNFYAEGTAPNYFGGNIQVVGLYTNPAPGSDQNSLVSVNNVANHANTNVTQSINFVAGKAQNVGGNRLQTIGFQVNSDFGEDYTDGSKAAYGFKSNMDAANGTGENNLTYNFYAEGTAENYFAGDLTVSTIPDFNINSNGNSGQLGTTITPGGFLLNRFQDASPTTVGAQFKRLGNASIATSTDAIVSFLYASYNQTDAVVASNAIKMDGSGGVILEPLSDYRVKENIIDLPSAVDTIKALRPVNFNFNWAPGKTRPGFVAHEVADVLPVAVVGEKDAVDEEGNPNYQSVDQTKLIPLLTKALQECLERIETLEAAIS